MGEYLVLQHKAMQLTISTPSFPPSFATTWNKRLNKYQACDKQTKTLIQ